MPWDMLVKISELTLNLVLSRPQQITETVLELDDDFLNPGPVRALSRTPSHISQSNFFQASQAREVAQDRDIDGDAAEAMRATGGDLELEEDFDFFVDDSRLSPDADRPPETGSSRTAQLRLIATQPVPPAHAIQSDDQVTDNTIEGDSLHNKKQKLASEDEDGLELEMEDEFNYLQATKVSTNQGMSTSKNSDSAALTQAPLPLETHTTTNLIFSSSANSVSDPVTRDAGPSDPDLGVPQIPSVPIVEAVSSASEPPNTSMLLADHTVASSSSTTANLEISTRWASLAPVTAVTFDGRQPLIQQPLHFGVAIKC